MKLKSVAQSLAALALLAAPMAAAPSANAATLQEDPQMTPFKIIGNLYYVGATGHGAYLISTPKGLILINSNYPNSPPLIRQSVEALGFKWSDIKILLISHAHIDHDGGAAEIVKETGAKYEVMQPDVSVVESGGRDDYNYGTNPQQYYPVAHVDRVLHDLDTVELGGFTLTAHLTPGHTKGDTTWTFDETNDAGKALHVVLMGGPTLNPGMQLIDNPKYPQIVSDYEHGFDVLRALPCDIPLGPHDWYFDLGPKYKRFMAGDKDAFVDPAGYKAFVDKSQKGFERLLAAQKAAVAAGQTPEQAAAMRSGGSAPGQAGAAAPAS
ncbi:MAG TPA: subclass B3 metallo-beta-lactamase [Caulobacteraceae bacterium]|nr:subclass B3 metallo-beta-lactamase [Caulobacteraceae bacterium]